MSRRLRQTAAFSLLASLLVGYGIVLYGDDDNGNQSLSSLESNLQTRALRLQDETEAEDLAREAEARVLAMTGNNPPTADEVAGEYIVKPWVGYAQANVYETTTSRLILNSAQSSTVEGAEFLPRFVLEPHPNRWESSSTYPDPEEWLQIDTGSPQVLQEIYIQWHESAYAVDYTVQVAPERPNCRSNGGPCPDYWITTSTVTGKSNGNPTTENLESGDLPMPSQGVRYIRIRLNTLAAGQSNFSVYQVKVYRKKMIVGESPTGTYCGATTSAITGTLLARHGGSLIQTFEAAEFFHASMTASQKDSMNADPCTFTVEPNFIVRARGRTTEPNKRNLQTQTKTQEHERHHRRLAIPEFNLRDENPPNWGLERISSHGRRNGKYTWFHEGEGVNLYVFDTGIYPDHSDWLMRNGTSRLETSQVCAGSASDYALNDHGTHVASLAAGFTFGTGKSAKIHPVQVLNSDGEGTTASFLCGVERVIQDGKDYIANNPADAEKYQAVINLSLGVNGRSDAMDKAVQDMTDAGYIVVIAAGDNAGNACFYSPYHYTAITVGALQDHVDGYNDKTLTSNYGQCVDVWGPGEEIVGASNSGEYESSTKSGTSVAAAFASGVATLFLESTNTDEIVVEEVATFVKEKMLNKAENYILGEVGHGSPGRMLQTTVSRCSLNSHCEAGLTCLFDGTCRDLSEPLKL